MTPFARCPGAQAESRAVKLLPLLMTITMFTACTAPAPGLLADAGPDGPAATTGVREIDLGSVTSDVPVEVSIPEHTLGFHIVVEAGTATEPLGIASLRSPSGELAIDECFPIGIRSPAAGQLGIAAASVPHTSFTASRPVEPGVWTVEFFIASGQPARAKVFVRTTPDGAFHGGALDVRVYIPEGLEQQRRVVWGSPLYRHAE